MNTKGTMYSRPKPKETDEDLLRLQEVFNQQKLENEFKLAATVVSEKLDNQQDNNEAAVQDQIANTFEAIPQHEHLGSIVEKRSQQFEIKKLNFNTKGFPTPKRRDTDIENSHGSGSIFARQFKRVKTISEPEQVELSLPSQSFVVTGSERNDIHEENVQKMKNMTRAEILDEREKLLETMDPAIVAYLKSRRKHEETKMKVFRNETIQEQNEVAENINVANIETLNEILENQELDKWLNFKTMETNKLAWMRNIEIPKIAKSDSFEARFDFEGFILPFVEEEITERSRILYHHGEEAGRPGYTLQELFQLSRSNVIQQKIIALNTIANILSLHSTGVFDDVIELPLEQIFFVLRFCLDDNTPTVLNASIKAMRNLFYSKIDETCLDCLLSFGVKVQPILAIDNEPDDDRINDQQLAEVNLVKCLARTEILNRVRYVIHTVQPSVETVIYCLDILTRLAKDSSFILDKIYTTENLVSCIIKYFVPNVADSDSTSSYGLPLLQALKFLRVLSSRSETIAKDLTEKYDVMPAILTYLSSHNYSKNTNGLKLQTESFHLWSVFLHYGLTRNHLQVLQPVLHQLLNYHYHNTNLDLSTTFVRQGHLSALLVLLSNGAAVVPYIEIIQYCAYKWFTQLTTLNDFSCGKLQIVAALFHCACTVENSEVFDEVVLKVLNSEGFNLITKFCTNGSMLLNNYESLKSSANLKTLEAATWLASEHVVPLLQSNSPLPFLNCVSDFITASTNKELKLAFLRNDNIKLYLNELRHRDKYYLTSNWFTRLESNLVLNILKCSVVAKTELDARFFYEIAVKTLSIYVEDQKPDIEHVLQNIVFSKEYYPSEVLMRNLSIEQRTDSLATSLENLQEILQVYVKVLSLRTEVPTSKRDLSADHNKGNVIPLDWIYTPIIVIYSDQQQNKTSLNEQEQVFVVRNALRWILIYETYFPELASVINPTDRFCRIACVFLGSDSLFLIEEVHGLLRLCLNNIIKNEAHLNFNKEIQGLSSFQDFYTQLLEQYQGVSYGDVLFGNFVLVPLVQRHSVKWRKILWSEYAGVVEFFNVTQEQSVCPLNSFLEPNEEDLSLLKCYRRAIVNNSVRKHSILYHIAKYHVDKYLSNKRK